MMYVSANLDMRMQPPHWLKMPERSTYRVPSCGWVYELYSGVRQSVAFAERINASALSLSVSIIRNVEDNSHIQRTGITQKMTYNQYTCHGVACQRSRLSARAGPPDEFWPSELGSLADNEMNTSKDDVGKHSITATTFYLISLYVVSLSLPNKEFQYDTIDCLLLA